MLYMDLCEAAICMYSGIRWTFPPPIFTGTLTLIPNRKSRSTRPTAYLKIKEGSLRLSQAVGVIQRATGFPILFAAMRVWTDSFSGVDADFGMHTLRRSDAVSRLRKVVRMNESRNFIVLCD